MNLWSFMCMYIHFTMLKLVEEFSVVLCYPIEITDILLNNRGVF